MNNERNLTKHDKTIKAITSVAFGTLVTAIICAVMLVVLSLVFTKSQVLPYKIISQIVIVISTISALIGGIVTSKLSKFKGLALGAIMGLVFFIIVSFVSVIIIGEPLSVYSLLRAVLIVLAGSLGGVIGINKKKKRRR